MSAKVLCELVSGICQQSDDLRFLVFPAMEGGHVGDTLNLSYPAAQALWYLLGVMRPQWRPAFVDHENARRYFLRSPDGVLVLNPTLYECEVAPPYQDAKFDGFLTSWPCGRAFKIMERAGYGWPLDQGDSVCVFCRGTGERVAIPCECCGRPAICMNCGGSGIRRVQSR